MRIHKLMMPAVTLAGALALAGCGGGGGTATTGSQTCAADETGTFPNCVTAEQTAATKAIEDANAAVEALGDSPTGTAVVAAAGMVREAQLRIDALPAADQAAEDAKLADSIATINTIAATLDIPPQFTTAGTLKALTDEIDGLEDLAAGADEDGSVLKTARAAFVKAQSAVMLKGVSADVGEEAKKVAQEKTKLEKAVMDTEAAKMAAETAKKGLEETDSQYGLLDAAIERADKAIKAAKALLAPGGGVAALAAEFPEMGDKSPAKRADGIGTLVHTALLQTGINGDGDGDDAIPTGDDAKDVFADGSTRTSAMRTFAQLFAGSTSPQAWADNEIVNAISLKDEPADGDGNGDDSALTAVLAAGVAESTLSAYTFRGIDGMAGCRNTKGCTVADSKLGDGWYFYPTSANADAYFTTETVVDAEGKVATSYKEATFAAWGMWLDNGGTSNALRVNRHVSVTPSTNANAGLGTAVAADEPASARYRGTATGLSARKTGTESNAPTASGHFLADVDLRASFGTSASLTGDIENFRAANENQGSAHVNSDWKLDLESGDGEFGSSGVRTDEGTFGTGAEGSWFADAYGGSNTANGVDGKRPTGVVGGFNAAFDGDDNGRAAGVFHAIK